MPYKNHINLYGSHINIYMAYKFIWHIKVYMAYNIYMLVNRPLSRIYLQN